MKRVIILLGLTLFSSYSYAQAYSQDAGIIKNFHANNGGGVAVTIEGGYVNANLANQCPDDKAWAGEHTLDPILKSALLTAYTSGKPVTITTLGCTAGGWLKIIDVYLN